MTTGTWIAVAYVNRERDHLFNAERRQITKVSTSNPLLKLKRYLAKKYLDTQEYNHIELAFPCETTNKGECVAYGLFWRDGLVKKTRNFTNPAYEWLYLSVTKEEQARVLRFCENERIACEFNKDRGIDSYDEFNMYWSVLWPSGEHNKWWCVPFVIAALQTIGILKYYDPYSLDIDDVVFLLSDHSRALYGFTPNQTYKLSKGEIEVSLFSMERGDIINK